VERFSEMVTNSVQRRRITFPAPAEIPSHWGFREAKRELVLS